MLALIGWQSFLVTNRIRGRSEKERPRNFLSTDKAGRASEVGAVGKS